MTTDEQSAYPWEKPDTIRYNFEKLTESSQTELFRRLKEIEIIGSLSLGAKEEIESKKLELNNATENRRNSLFIITPLIIALLIMLEIRVSNPKKI